MTPFWELVRFELTHQARQRAAWVYAVVLMGLAFVAMTMFVTNARGNLFNAPLAIAGATIITSMLGLLVSAALAGDAATRDAQTRMEPLMHTAPLTRWDYTGGRFAGAFTLNAVLLMAAPAGIGVAGLWAWAEGAAVGAFAPAAYLSAYSLFALSNAFIAVALLFSAATLSRSAVASYAGALALFLATMILDGAVAEAMGQWELAKLLDPFGIVLLRQNVMSWTPLQKDTLLVALDGPLLLNRTLWLTFSLAALTMATHAARRQQVTASRRRRGDVAEPEPVRVLPARSMSNGSAALPSSDRGFGFTTHARQAVAIAWRSFQTIAIGRGVVVLVFPAAFLVLFGPQYLVHFGTPLLPTTALVVNLIANSGDIFLAIAAPFLTVVYAGQLVWREREARLSDVADAAPVPDWVPFAGKLLGLGLVLTLLQALMFAAAVLLQTSMGYDRVEPGALLAVLFGFQLADYLPFAVLALAVHAAVNHKYVGHLVVLLTYAFTMFAAAMGIEHNLLVYGSDPGWAYSDMRGFAPYVAPFLWFKLYWGAWALIVAIATRLLWVRGRELGFRARLGLARQRSTQAVLGVAAAAAGLILAAGGVIFYNTNVLNAYTTAAGGLEQRAEYERRYARYRNLPQPSLTGTKLNVGIYPALHEASIRGTFTLTNRSGAAIDAVHVTTSTEADTLSLTLDRAAARRLSDDELHYDVFDLHEPLPDGAVMQLDFELRVARRGFRNSGNGVLVLGNVSVLGQWLLPAVGYQAQRELQAAGERSAHRLPARAVVPSLHDISARHDRAASDRTDFEAVVSTDAHQTAVAPGALQRTWSERGRRYFHYVTDAPIRNDYALMSADYAVHTAAWKDVTIEILHHPDHRQNLDRMVRGVQASLEYYTRHFGSYPYRQLRLVERPGDGNSLHSAPVNISFEEGFPLLNADDDPRGLDFPFAIVAHEVAHQWWGNQVTPAFAEGGALVTESLAWLSAFAVVEETYGHAHLERLLQMMRSAYVIPRARAAVPLLRADDWFLAYRKGALAMHAVREYIGAEQMNVALRRLLAAHGAGRPPLPTSLDLYRQLQSVTPDALLGLLADLFERNTYWELTTEHVTSEPRDGGRWDVSLDVRARKLVVDEHNVETELAMEDLVEVGVFAESGDGASERIYLQRHRIRSGVQRVTVTVPAEPTAAGIDPRHLLIDVDVDDNVRRSQRPPDASPNP